MDRGRSAASSRGCRAGRPVTTCNQHHERQNMTTMGLVNIGVVATGVLAAPRLEAESIFVEHGRIVTIGVSSKTGAGRADVVVDCLGDDRHSRVDRLALSCG